MGIPGSPGSHGTKGDTGLIGYQGKIIPKINAFTLKFCTLHLMC